MDFRKEGRTNGDGEGDQVMFSVPGTSREELRLPLLGPNCPSPEQSASSSSFWSKGSSLCIVELEDPRDKSLVTAHAGTVDVPVTQRIRELPHD